MSNTASRSRFRSLLTAKRSSAASEKGDLVGDISPADSFTADSVKDFSPASLPPPIYPSKPKQIQGGAKAFVAQLIRKADTRRHLAQLLGEYCCVEGGDCQVSNWIKDEGFNTTISGVLEALDEARSKDLLFWSSRYHLFVLWSANGEHPWDVLPAAEVATATLEIGSRRGSENQVVVLLNGRAITSYTFDNCVLRTTNPVEWETPDGQVAKVHLHLQMSAFSGYGKQEEQNAYLGLQTHGVLWPADMTNLPTMWPITPPIVAGKVNIAARVAAIAPGKIDALSAFEGVYTTHYVFKVEGAPAKNGPTLTIKVSGGHPSVTLNGKSVACWTFVANNVLAWEDDAGYSAWLQFIVLPGGPVFMGDLHPNGELSNISSSGGFNVFGELEGQASRLSPDMHMDSTVGQLVASGLATAGTLLCASLLRNAQRCWQLAKSGGTEEGGTAEHDELLRLMEADFAALAHFQAVGAATESTFPWGPEVREMDPEATLKATTAQAEAAENTTAAKTAAVAAEEALAAVQSADDVVEATSKAAVAAWRANQAAASAQAAEANALAAALHARAARTSAALVASMAAAQSFNMAKESAYEAAKAGASAAQAALESVEHNVSVYVQRKDYLKLKDIAEASDIAGKALQAAKQAVAGWEAGSVSSRRTSAVAANEAAEFAQLCHKVLRAVHRE